MTTVRQEDLRIGCDPTEEKRIRDRIRSRYGDLVCPTGYSERLRRLVGARKRRQCRGGRFRVLCLALVLAASLTGCASIAEGVGSWWDCWMDESNPACQEEGEEVGAEAAEEAVAAVYELSPEGLDAETRLADLARPGRMTHDRAVWAVLVHLYEVHGLARCDTQPETVRDLARCERVAERPDDAT